MMREPVEVTDRTTPSSAPCYGCHQTVRFFFDALARTFEVCDTRGCPGSVPHAPRSSGKVLPAFVVKVRKRKQ